MTRSPCSLAARITGALVLAAGIATAAGAAVPYQARIARVNRVGLTITNYGFFGTNFINRSPSFEFPIGSGYEHMARAGLWVGGRPSDAVDFIGVSCGAVDNAQGTNALAETEFTPATEIVERSRIPNSPVFSAGAISDQDLTTSYLDAPGRGPQGAQSERHVPLGIEVRQRTLGFSLDAADAFVVAQFAIVNQGAPLRDVYVGLYAQLVSGDKNAYSTWPPSSTAGPGSWYYRTYADYDAGRRLFREHYCASPPVPAGCNFAYCPPWAGVMLLGTSPDTIASKTVSFNWWSYGPRDTTRDTDRERYAILSNGQIMDPRDCTPGLDCSPIMLLSVGPFAVIDPGDSIRVDFAFVAGEDEASFLAHSAFAQFASDIDYQLPTPPPSPRLLVETGERRVDFYWDDSPEFAEDPTSPAPLHRDFEGYRVYLGLDRQHPSRVAQFDRNVSPHDTTGFNTGVGAIRLDPPRIVDGVTYRYRYSIDQLRDGLSYFGAVTSYDLGDTQIPSLESGIPQNKFQAVPLADPEHRTRAVTVFPNPYRVQAVWDQGALVRDHYLWFANLPRRCVIRIYTLAGDRVFETDFDGGAYRGAGARGLYDSRQDFDTAPPTLSGASFAWNLITREGQAAATGLYLFAVEDLEAGGVERGKFLIVKSDREN